MNTRKRIFLAQTGVFGQHRFLIACMVFVSVLILLYIAEQQQAFRPLVLQHAPWHSSLGFELSKCLAAGESGCWVEAKRRAWLESLDEIQNNFTEVQLMQYRDPVRKHRTADLWPITYDCDLNNFVRIGAGARADGGKWICGPLDLTKECIVFSLGSNGDFRFERAFQEYAKNISANCKIFTFDCTGDWKDKSTTFKPWCIGSEDTIVSGRIYKRIPTILKDLNLPHITYLKMDIEGYEWQAIPDILDSGILPQQISFEIHSTLEYAPFVKDLGPNSNWAYPLIRLGRHIDSKGYRVAVREDNLDGDCEGCTEFVLVRV